MTALYIQVTIQIQRMLQSVRYVRKEPTRISMASISVCRAMSAHIVSEYAFFILTYL